MDDRLLFFLKWFELEARVFQAGPLCHSPSFDAADGLAYIHVLKEGGLRVETAGHAPVELERPTLILYLTPISHRLTPLGDDVDMVCASVGFGRSTRNPLAHAIRDVLLLELGEIPNLGVTLDLLFREAFTQHCGRQAVLDRLTEVVVIQLLRDLMDQGRVHSGLLAGLADKRLARAINAMHADPSRSWSLQELAAMAGMSRARFALRFREILGLTPGAYLTEWRLSIARSLLRRGRSVQQVADEVGYTSASALSRAFTAQIGLSPTQWRKLNLDTD